MLPHRIEPQEYEISEAIDLLIRLGRTIDAIRLKGWRMDISYPEDHDEAERRLQEGGMESDLTASADD